MSKFVINQSCNICNKIEKALTTMTVGKTKHHICYDCMAIFALDVADFAIINLNEEMRKKGYVLTIEKAGEQNG